MQTTDAESFGENHREMSFRYSVNVSSETVYICKRAFMRVHDISASKIRHITDQIKSGSTAPHPSQRGKHGNRPNMLPLEAVQQVINHIKLFPAESSHYSREKNSSRLYLSSTLSIEKMYTLYREWLRNQNNQTTADTALHGSSKDLHANTSVVVQIRAATSKVLDLRQKPSDYMFHQLRFI